MASTQHPTTRSRTGLYLSYRDSRARFSRARTYEVYSSAEQEDDHLLDTTPTAGQAHRGIDLALPPNWVDYADQVEQVLLDTQAKITALERLHAKHVLPGFTDRTLEEREIEALTTDVTRDFRQCQSLITKIGVVQTHSFPPPQVHDQNRSAYTTQDTLAAKNVQRALAAKVQDLSAKFRKKQRVYMENLQGHAIKNQDLLLASGAVSLKGAEGMSAVDEDVEAATHTQSQSQAIAGPSPEVTARTHELDEIAKSIGALAELFRDLSVLVIDQGTLLDSVEYNIEIVESEVREAARELGVAERYQKNTGRRKCIFLLLLIIFGLILVLIFKPRRHAAAPSGSDATRVPPPPPPFEGKRSRRRTFWS